ncbi:MAG: carboxypeptidase regulatory-like domain-containing protein [Verrucomicrobiales bacterium]|nr:carboxypeptidase regulatory-like domain-containing protein [Verrucomicrobiales bacterium]
MKLTWIIAWAGVMACSSEAGTISGSVHAEGKVEAEQAASGGKYDSRKYKFVPRIDYSALRDFVVYIEGPMGGKAAMPEQPLTVDTRRIKQKGAVFIPHVLPVVVGATVEWPNNDEIFHNVFSYSETKPFDLGLYKEPEVKRMTFDKPGRVDVFCSIHANMHCIILVLENPYFATTDENGHYSIVKIPPGTYQVTAWHERLPKQVKEVIVPENGDVKLDFVLGIKNLPKY